MTSCQHDSKNEKCFKLLWHLTSVILQFLLSSCNSFCRLAIMLMARGNVALNICNVLSTGEEVAGGSAAVLMDVIVGQGAGGGEKIVEKDSKYERDN